MMSDSRQSPEELLALVTEQEIRESRGRLKIFLGAAAGVGKTYAMLESARILRSEGVDVVAGLVETHGRKETEVLLEGLPLIPLRQSEYRGVSIREFDLDATLQRRPQLVLVDELAHTNAPGSRHEKRWQDVEELLQAGINVQTTLNIQHLESVNDLINQIVGIKVHETIPDSIFDRADEIELIDLPPDELIQRLREGKIYLPETSAIALQNFFQKGNLIALRELALRATAQCVDAEMLRYRAETFVKEVWPVNERLLVCVGPSPLSARLVRATKRMATRLRADWIGIYVETPQAARLPEKDRNRVLRTLHLVQKLGGEPTRITGTDVPDELIRFAQKTNASKIIIGKPARPRWRELLFGSIVDDVIRKSGPIDIYVISGDKSGLEAISSKLQRAPIQWLPYAYAVAAVVLVTIIAKLTLQHLATVNLAMVYQLAVVLIAVRYGKGPSILATLLSVVAFDYFFIPPYFSFAISDTQYLITFLVMLMVGLILSTLTSTVKLQAELARKRERQTAALYAMAREQASAKDLAGVVNTSLRHIADVFETKVVLWATVNPKQLQLVEHQQPSFGVDAKEEGVAHWVFLNDQPAGATTATLAGAKALYLPLRAASGVVGVIGILPSSYERLGNPDEMHLLETFVYQTALAVERARFFQQSAALDGRTLRQS